ncbi:hypothetical protein [Kitasatospora sp. NPDC056181]|uniref:hypothetical protein n=1 Tax=Kitasatospora sp. NPDC056181 TaxID=3345737 RepID=UPI0035E0993E
MDSTSPQPIPGGPRQGWPATAIPGQPGQYHPAIGQNAELTDDADRGPAEMTGLTDVTTDQPVSVPVTLDGLTGDTDGPVILAWPLVTRSATDRSLTAHPNRTGLCYAPVE